MTNPPEISEPIKRKGVEEGRPVVGHPLHRAGVERLETVQRNDPRGERESHEGRHRRESEVARQEPDPVDRGRMPGRQPVADRLRDARRPRLEGRNCTRPRIGLHMWLESRDTELRGKTRSSVDVSPHWVAGKRCIDPKPSHATSRPLPRCPQRRVPRGLGRVALPGGRSRHRHRASPRRRRSVARSAITAGSGASSRAGSTRRRRQGSP